MKLSRLRRNASSNVLRVASAALLGGVMVVGVVAMSVGASGATASPLVHTCSNAQTGFLQQVCARGVTGAWRGVTIGQSDAGPTPAMYARLARAVSAGDAAVCDDQWSLAFIEGGARLDQAAAKGMCLNFIRESQQTGSFEIGDPATGETISIGVSR